MEFLARLLAFCIREHTMRLVQDPLASFATDTSLADTADLDAMVFALAAERQGDPVETESGGPAWLQDSEAGARNKRGMELRRNGDLQGALLAFDVIGHGPG